MLPPHKRLFISHQALISRKDISSSLVHRLELSESPTGALYADLIDIGFIRIDEQLMEEIHLSFDAERYFLNTKYDKTDPPLMPKLGLFSTKDIKAFVLKKQRLCATLFPGVKATYKVHGSKELPGTIVAHDKNSSCSKKE